MTERTGFEEARDPLREVGFIVGELACRIQHDDDWRIWECMYAPPQRRGGHCSFGAYMHLEA